jgi:hypothetical protein
MARIVDNLKCYLSEVIRECLLARPEILRSRESLTYETALRCSSMEELKEVIVDGMIDELTFSGFPKLLKWVVKRLGVPEIEKFPGNSTLLSMFEVRNCLVHNRGRVSPKYKRAIAPDDASVQIGERLKRDSYSLEEASRASAAFVEKLDELLSLKFYLACHAWEGANKKN